MKRVLQFFLVAVSLVLASPAFAQLVIPEIPYDSAPNLLKLPVDLYMGEAAGVATNSKGHIFVYTRTGSTNVTTGTNRAFVRASSRLLEFDEKGNYVREIGHGIYAFLFAQAVHIDPQDNIWVVDQGGSMVIKFDPDGHVVMTFGRKPEEIRVPSEPMPGFVPPPPPLTLAVVPVAVVQEEEVAAAERLLADLQPIPAQAPRAIVSGAPQTWPGIQMEISLSLMVMTIRGLRSSIRMENISSPGEPVELGRDNSIRRIPSL